MKLILTLLGCSALAFGQPSVVAVAPLNGSGQTATFTAVYRHPGGVNKHYLAYLLILPTPNVVQFTASGSCLVEYNRISGGVRLIDNAATGWLGGPSGVKVGVLANNYCSVNTAAVTASYVGTDLTLTVPLTFFGTFTGQMGTFLQTNDVDDNWTGMTQFGNWTANAIAAPKPGPYVRGVVTPAYTLAPAKVDVDTGHTAGLNRVFTANILVAESIVGGNVRCHIIYFADTQKIELVNDAGTGFVTTSPKQNSTCAIGSFNGELMFASGTTNEVHLRIPMLWNPDKLTRRLNVWVNTFDHQGNLTHWLQ